MIKSLLFDLDDTLIGNDSNVFVPAYFEQLVRYIQPAAGGQRFIQEVLAGTRAMIANTDPLRSLNGVFEGHFYPALGLDPAEWRPRWEAFYATVFPNLQPQTTFRPEARAVVDWAVGAGLRLVIATSPIFPLRAIQERLRWAGLEGAPFERITCLENSHFAKPHPEYYAEILAHLDARPEEALLVGNDWEADMRPAAALGLPHYWIAPAERQPPVDHPGPLAGIGSLEDFLAWAQSGLADYTPPPGPDLALASLLAGDLAALAGHLEGLDAAGWQARPSPDEWSVGEIACHLRDVEREVHLPRLRAIVETNNPFFSAADTDLWAEALGYRTQSGPQAWAEFAAARGDTLAYLRAQPAEAWRRPARHAILGPTHLAEMVSLIVDHDRLHRKQLEKSRAALA